MSVGRRGGEEKSTSNAMERLCLGMISFYSASLKRPSYRSRVPGNHAYGRKRETLQRPLYAPSALLILSPSLLPMHDDHWAVGEGGKKKGKRAKLPFSKKRASFVH